MTEPSERGTSESVAIEDIRDAEAAGIKCARQGMLAGIETATFMVALAEQEFVTRRAITDAGGSSVQADLLVEHFGNAARDEWYRLAQRIAGGSA